MYKNEKWNELSDVVLGAGVLTQKMPGTNLNMNFSGGKAYVNETGNVGYVALDLSGVDAVASGEKASGMIGALGEQMREMLNNPSVRQHLDQTIKGKQMYLFVSVNQDGRKVISIPGTNTGSEEDAFESVVGTLEWNNEVPSVDAVYAFHSKLTDGRELQSDKAVVSAAVKTVVSDAQAVYDKCLELAKQSWF
ncbi:hypothetical protein HZA97_06685 [Candidatus Woesearchaeota archaeon]|nr:hypothetical protein [Candidatus Woesearchaeota archaeon]